MDEPLQQGPHDPESPPEVLFVPTDTGFTSSTALERKRFLRRVQIILAAGLVSYSLAAWVLLRKSVEMHMGAQDPVQVVRTEIGALGRGDLEAAYSQLSERYRQQVPFEAYHRLVVEHRRIFFARSYRVIASEKHGGQTFVVADIQSMGGESYTAHFTLVQSAGRWWIDDLHWNSAGRTIMRET